MKTFTHTGSVIYSDGSQLAVDLRLAEKHWIDGYYHKWRFVDGSKAGNALGTWPRLLTHTIRRRPVDAPKQARKLTHECRVKNTYGVSKIRQFRETKLFWIDRDGAKFRKDGDSVCGKFRMAMAELVEYQFIEGVAQPIKRSPGNHMPV